MAHGRSGHEEEGRGGPKHGRRRLKGRKSPPKGSNTGESRVSEKSGGVSKVRRVPQRRRRAVEEKWWWWVRGDSRAHCSARLSLRGEKGLGGGTDHGDTPRRAGGSQALGARCVGRPPAGSCIGGSVHVRPYGAASSVCSAVSSPGGHRRRRRRASRGISAVRLQARDEQRSVITLSGGASAREPR